MSLDSYEMQALIFMDEIVKLELEFDNVINLIDFPVTEHFDFLAQAMYDQLIEEPDERKS